VKKETRAISKIEKKIRKSITTSTTVNRTIKKKVKNDIQKIITIDRGLNTSIEGKKKVEKTDINTIQTDADIA